MKLTRNENLVTGVIRTNDARTLDMRFENGKILTANQADGPIDLGKLWDGLLNILAEVGPAERAPLLEKLDKKRATNWGKDNAVGMRSTKDFGRAPPTAEEQNEINRKFWAQRNGTAA
jgi:hypothetical protein